MRRWPRITACRPRMCVRRCRTRDSTWGGYARTVFKNAQGKFDGKVFMGLMMGLGAGVGMVIKLWASMSDSVAPFWLWAVPAVLIAVGFVGWVGGRRERAELKARVERSARVRGANDRRTEGGVELEEVEGRTHV